MSKPLNSLSFVVRKQLSFPPPSQQQKQTGHYAPYAYKQHQSLSYPFQNTRQYKKSRYSYLVRYLRRFNELGLLPNFFLLNWFDVDSGVEAALSANNERYHKTY